MFNDPIIIEAVDYLVFCLTDDNKEYRANLSIDSKINKLVGSVTNGKLTVFIYNKRGKASFYIRDEAKFQYGVKEGFSIDEIQCYSPTDAEMAEILLTHPELWDEAKMDVVKEKNSQ